MTATRRRDLPRLSRVRLRRVSGRAGLVDRAHAPVCVCGRAGRRAAAPRRRRAAARLRPLHPRARGGRGRARHRHPSRGRRARIPLRAFRAGDRGADPAPRRGEALSLRDRSVVPRRALAGFAPQPRAAGRPLLGGRGRSVRGVAARGGRRPAAAVRRRRQGRRARHARPRALPAGARSRDPERRSAHRGTCPRADRGRHPRGLEPSARGSARLAGVRRLVLLVGGRRRRAGLRSFFWQLRRVGLAVPDRQLGCSS